MIKIKSIIERVIFGLIIPILIGLYIVPNLKSKNIYATSDIINISIPNKFIALNNINNVKLLEIEIYNNSEDELNVVYISTPDVKKYYDYSIKSKFDVEKITTENILLKTYDDDLIIFDFNNLKIPSKDKLTFSIWCDKINFITNTKIMTNKGIIPINQNFTVNGKIKYFLFDNIIAFIVLISIINIWSFFIFERKE